MLEPAMVVSSAGVVLATNRPLTLALGYEARSLDQLPVHNVLALTNPPLTWGPPTEGGKVTRRRESQEQGVVVQHSRLSVIRESDIETREPSSTGSSSVSSFDGSPMHACQFPDHDFKEDFTRAQSSIASVVCFDGSLAKYHLDVVPMDRAAGRPLEVAASGKNADKWRGIDHLVVCKAAKAAAGHLHIPIPRWVKQMSEMLQSVEVPVLVVDRWLRMQHINTAASVMFKYNPQELLGEHLSLVLPEQSADALTTVATEMSDLEKNSPETRSKVVFTKRKDGVLKHMDLAVCQADNGTNSAGPLTVLMLFERRTFSSIVSPSFWASSSNATSLSLSSNPNYPSSIRSSNESASTPGLDSLPGTPSFADRHRGGTSGVVLSHRLFELALHASRFSIVVVDRKFRILVVSKAAMKFFGYLDPTSPRKRSPAREPTFGVDESDGSSVTPRKGSLSEDSLIGNHLSMLVPEVRRGALMKLVRESETTEDGDEENNPQPMEVEAKAVLKSGAEVGVVMRVNPISSLKQKRLFVVNFRQEDEDDTDDENASRASWNPQVMCQAVLQSMLEAAVVANQDMVILYVNPAACNLFGYTAEELIGEPVNKLMPKEMSDRHDTIVQTHMETKKVTIMGKQEGHRVMAQHKSGDQLPLLLCLSKGIDRTGEVTFTATFRDLRHILARVTAEKMALSTQARFEAVLNSMLTPAVVASKQMVILFVNPAACELFGYSNEELLGSKVNKLMPKDMAERHDSIVASHLLTGKATIIGKTQGHEVVAQHKDGYPLHLRLSLSAGCDDYGEKLFTGVFRDMREAKARVTAEKQVVNAQARLEAVLNSMLEPAVVANQEMSIVFINNAACTLFGYKREKLLGHNVKVLMAPEVGARHDKIVGRYLSTGRARVVDQEQGITVKARQKGGELIPVLLSLSKGIDEAGNLVFTATFRDLREQTRRLKAEQLIVSNQARFEKVLNTMLEPALLVTKSMRILFANQAAIELLLYTESELLGKRVNKLVMPSRNSTAAASPKAPGFKRFSNNKEEINTNRLGWDRLLCSSSIEGHHEVTVRQKSGQLVPAMLSLAIVPDTKGEIAFSVTFYDRRPDLASIQAEMRCEAVLRSMLAPAVVANKEMQILFVNPAACDLFQYSEEELLGQKVNKLMPTDMASLHDNIVSTHLLDGKRTVMGKPEGHDVIGACKDGTPLPLVLSLSRGTARGEPVFTATFAERR